MEACAQLPVHDGRSALPDVAQEGSVPVTAAGEPSWSPTQQLELAVSGYDCACGVYRELVEWNPTGVARSLTATVIRGGRLPRAPRGSWPGEFQGSRFAGCGVLSERIAPILSRWAKVAPKADRIQAKRKTV